MPSSWWWGAAPGSWELQLVSSNIIKSQAGASPLAPLDRPKAVVSLMKGSLLQNWAPIHLHYGGAVYLLIYTPRTLPGRGWRPREGAERLSRHRDADERIQTEHPILPGPAVCQCLGDKRELRPLGMGQIQAKTGGRG